MSRAIDSLSRFVGGADISFARFDTTFLGEWTARQFYDGYYPKTVAYNLSKIAALYNKAVADDLAPASSAFSTVLSRVNGIGARFAAYDHSSTFSRLLSVSRADCAASPSRQLAKDIILFGIFSGGMTLRRIAAFKKDDPISENPHLRRIVERYSKPKNKYLFPLHQSRLTPKQLLESIIALLDVFLKPLRTLLSTDPDNLLIDLWSDVAMSCGASAAEIAACLSPYGVTNALTFCVAPAGITEKRISDIRSQVIEVLTDNPLHWYALHLRRQTDFEQLTTRLKEKDIALDEIFYPMEEITRKVGKKLVFQDRPIISWLVFYRARVTQLPRMFHEIGDLAWGYRYFRDVTSPYAIIPATEVRDYQQAIGTLSPSTRLRSDTDLRLHEGDHVIILGGPLNGYPGTFITEKKEKGNSTGRTIYRIALTSGNNINWEVDWDPQLVKKITPDQYNSLQNQADH